MINTLEANTIYAIHMRSPSSSGGKDWIGSVTPSGEIHTYWGKTGQVNQHAAKPGNRFSLDKIIGEKKSKGYREVDEFRNGRWDSQQTTTPAQPSKSKPVAEPIIPKFEIIPESSAVIQWDF